MLALDPTSIELWLLEQYGGRQVLDTGLEEDAIPSVQITLDHLAARLEALEETRHTLVAHLMDETTQVSLRALLCQLSTGRRLKLLTWIAESTKPRDNDILNRLLDPESLPSGAAVTLQADLIRHHQLGCMARIFAPERMTKLTAVSKREAQS